MLDTGADANFVDAWAGNLEMIDTEFQLCDYSRRVARSMNRISRSTDRVGGITRRRYCEILKVLPQLAEGVILLGSPFLSRQRVRLDFSENLIQVHNRFLQMPKRAQPEMIHWTQS